MNISEKLAAFPSFNFSFLPTPLHKLHNLSWLLNVNIYCKRDDLTGFALGGNKTRKLDYLIADAVTNDFDTIIAVGANQSNFCRMAAAASKVKQLEVHLVLQGKKPQEYTGNLLANQLMSPIIHHVEDMVEFSVQLEQELIGKRKKVYRLPWGGSTPTGALGYVKAGEEIIEQEKQLNVKFSKLFATAGTGGMLAGLEAAKVAMNWPCEIIGVSVAAPKNQVGDEISKLRNDTLQMIGLKNLDMPDVFIDDNYIGEGYGEKTQECVEAVKLFAEKEALFLDYVYTGKTAAALIDYIKKGKISQKDNVLFVHSGGNIELFE